MGGRADTEALLAEARRRFLPASMLALSEPQDVAALDLMPLLRARPLVDGRAAAYVCRNYVCNLPVTEPAQLGARLDS